MTEEAYETLEQRLRIEARFRGDLTLQVLGLLQNERGEVGTSYFIRPLPTPPGSRVGRQDAVAGKVSFLREKDGRWSVDFSPGAYQPLVLELLRHLYDVLLVLDQPLCCVFEDRKENLLLPLFGTESGLDRMKDYVWDVAQVAAGLSVSSFAWDSGARSFGYRPWDNEGVYHEEGVPVSKRTFEMSSLYQVTPSFRRVTDAGPSRFSVTVPLERGLWAPTRDGRALDLRSWLEGVAPGEYWRRSAWPDPLPDDAPLLPWTARSLKWDEEATSTSLEEALVEIGVIARDGVEERAVARRRAVEGRCPRSFELPLLLAEMPSVLVAPLSELHDIVESLGDDASPAEEQAQAQAQLALPGGSS